MVEFSTQTVITPREEKKNSLISLALFFLSLFIFLSICYLENHHHCCTANVMDNIALNLSSKNQRPRILTSTNGNQALHLVHFGFYVDVGVTIDVISAPFFSLLAQNFSTENDTEFNFMIALCVIIMKIHLVTFAKDWAQFGSVFIFHVFRIIRAFSFVLCSMIWIDKVSTYKKIVRHKYHTLKINKNHNCLRHFQVNPKGFTVCLDK